MSPVDSISGHCYVRMAALMFANAYEQPHSSHHIDQRNELPRSRDPISRLLCVTRSRYRVCGAAVDRACCGGVLSAHAPKSLERAIKSIDAACTVAVGVRTETRTSETAELAVSSTTDCTTAIPVVDAVTAAGDATSSCM